MKAIIVVMGLILGSQVMAASPVGTYYTPAYEMGEVFVPEVIRVISEGQIVDASVHYGAVIVQNYAYRVQGNQILVKGLNGEKTYNCNGKSVTYVSNETEIAATFEKTADGLNVTLMDMTISMKNATPEQIAKVAALPKCTETAAK